MITAPSAPIVLADYNTYLDRFKGFTKNEDGTHNLVSRSIPIHETAEITGAVLNERANYFADENCPYPTSNYESYKFTFKANVIPYSEITFNIAKSSRVTEVKLNSTVLTDTQWGYKSGKLCIYVTIGATDNVTITVTEALRSRDAKLGWSQDLEDSYFSTGLNKLGAAYPLQSYINDSLYVQYYTDLGDTEQAAFFQDQIDRIIEEANLRP